MISAHSGRRHGNLGPLVCVLYLMAVRYSKSSLRHPAPPTPVVCIQCVSVVRILLLSLLIAAFAVTPAFSQKPHDGPMGFMAMSSQSPLQQLRFGLLHAPPWVLPDGALAFYAEHNWRNVWLYSPGLYRIDAEIQELVLRGCMGIDGSSSVSIELPLRYVSGGILDGFIEDFHSFFGIANDYRDQFPRNQFAFEMNLDDGQENWSRAGTGQTGFALGNIVLGISRKLPYFRPLGIEATLSANLKLPTGTRTDYFGGQSVDVGAMISMVRGFGPLYLYASPGIVYYSQQEEIGIVLRQWHFSGLFAAELHPANTNNSWIAQLLIESGIAKTFGGFTQDTYELTMGYKRRLSKSTVLEIGVLENLFHFDNSPDIGLHAGFTRFYY